MSLFKNIPIPQNLISAIHVREMAIEHSINRFRAAFLIFIALLDTVTSIVIKEVHYSVRYEILSILISFFGITFIVLIHVLTRKGKKYRGFIKYFSVTIDLSFNFIFAIAALYWMNFTMPVSKVTFVILITIIFIFFNSLSVLRVDKHIVIYSSILTIILNSILILGLEPSAQCNPSMLLGYTTFFIFILSVFNLWVSNQILDSFLANKKLVIANEEISLGKKQIEQKNEELNQLVEEISSQRDEIEAQRDTVEQQKFHIEAIHQEVEQSIDYAKRLQQAILSSEEILKLHTSDHFIFFQPKDKVSGDFYWWTNIENHTIITAADCTGHGVPGAFMSMLGISFLREIVNKEYIIHPGVILRRLRKEIIKSLKQKGESGEQKDGMDMAIISIDHQTNIVQFSGANNPLYIVKPVIARSKERMTKQSQDKPLLRSKGMAISPNEQITSSCVLVMTSNELGLYEVKPDKMPIAIYERMDKFATHEIQLEEGDQLYMFSDGFADQFGGPKGKKFKYKPFKQLIMDNCQLSMAEQKTVLEKTFTEWKGNIEQVDDVLVLGVKI